MNLGKWLWQLVPSICMLSVWCALKQHSECPCSISAGEEEATRDNVSGQTVVSENHSR